MLKVIRNVVIFIFAALGVLFIALMLMPDDEETWDETEIVEEQEVAQAENINSGNAATEASVEEASAEGASAEEASAAAEEASATENSTEQAHSSGIVATVNIPKSEISDKVLKFKTVSLDGEVVTQDIFSDYDITVVSIWGTYCDPCIAEMGDYASFYNELPDNINLVGLICDVYDGIETNASDAKDILSDAGAKFLNLRTSDDLYDITGSYEYVPSSFFVDKEGHIVGKIMDGADFAETKAKLEGYLK
jgi:thiol-disulfide isomerase/thioredoxin